MAHAEPAPTIWPRRALRHVIAATDFSGAGEHAVARAILLAREHRARLTLAHIVRASLWEDAGSRLAQSAVPSPESACAVAAERLQRRADELAACGVACDVHVGHGRPVAELVRLAAARAADLVVIGARGAHPVREALVGTTAQKLLRASPCAVLVVKRAPPFDYAHVLAPTDFSAAARAALQATAPLVPTARLHIAHAFELPYDGLMLFASVDEAMIAHHHAAARERLAQELAAWADAAGIARARRTLHVEHGYPPTCIERWIGTLGIDLVAIAAHGKSEIEATFLGSVSLHTVLTAPCDVLLLRGAAFP